MKIRGRRECTECGARWSYYETGTVSCPDCGSVRSAGVDDERRRHTDAPVELDLRDARAAVETRSPREVASEAADAARSYLSARGFIDAGELSPLDDTFVAAAELKAAGSILSRSLDVDEEVEAYLLSLLAGADEGDRPDEVPKRLWSARGLGAAEAADAYREELVTWLVDHPDPAAREALGSLRDRVKRVRALEGAVHPEDADRLIATARAIGDYLRGDESALARAENLMARLD